MSEPPASVEVFCSYAAADALLWRELEKHLSLMQRQGLISLWYADQIIAGTERAAAIEEHLAAASIILLLVSADFLASDYHYGVELARAMQRHQTNTARVIPVLLRPVGWKQAPFGHLQALPLNEQPITMWRNRDEAFADVAAGIHRTIEDLPRFTVNTPRASLPAAWNIPYPRNPYFTGRDELLAQLSTQLRAGQATAISQPQAISGLGGVGKTQLAVEYAYRFRADYQAVLWARAESREVLISSFVTIANLLNLPQKEKQDQTIIVEAVKAWLQRHTGWLLILDNADELAVVREVLPPSFGGHLLLTTRAQAMGRLAQKIEVDTLLPEVGVLFLLRRAGLIAADAPLSQARDPDREHALQLTQELGGLPLALDQAGAYLEETRCGLAAYHRLYQQRRADLLKQRRGQVADHPESVATTWSLSFTRVEQANPAATDLLRCCAFLAPDAIPEELFTEGAKYLGPVLAPVASDPFVLNQAIEALLAYSLLQRDASSQTLSVHRLVQAVLRDAMSKRTHRQWAERTVHAVENVLPTEVLERTRERYERCLSHMQQAVLLIDEFHLTTSAAARLLHQTGWYLYYEDMGKDERAEPLFQRAVAIKEQQLGPEHPEVVTDLNTLALFYQDQDKYEQAELLFQRALAIYEQQLEPEHPGTVTSLNNLALLYKNQGKYEQAEPLYQRALAIYEQQLGPTHPDTATSLNTLAALYDAQGKYEQAEPLFQRALAIREQQLGPQHPDTQVTQENYALLLRAMGSEQERWWEETVSLETQDTPPASAAP